MTLRRSVYHRSLVVVYRLLCMMSAYTCAVQDKCDHQGDLLTCFIAVPVKVPDGVKNVYFLDFDFSNEIKSESDFSDHSWLSVSNLDITVNADRRELGQWIHNYHFSYAKNLRRLGIHGKQLYRLAVYAFGGLPKLVELDLSGCESMRSNVISAAIASNGSLPNLEYLNLNWVNSGYTISINQLSNMNKNKSIKQLSLSGTNILVQDPLLFKSTLLHSLEILDISNITLMKTTRIDLRQFLPRIKTLNISYTSSRTVVLTPNVIGINTTGCVTGSALFLLRQEHLYANGIIEEMVTIDNSTVDFRDCTTHWQTLQFKKNNVRKINGTFHWPKNFAIQELDLSSNGMVYASPNFIREMYSLKRLFLANNSLFLMESLPEFEELLATLSQLEHLDVSSNNLASIPYLMMINNTKLKILNLSKNKLRSITFKTTQLICLESLDLRFNAIVFLQGGGLIQVQSIFGNGRSVINGSVNIYFDGNPLECSCQSLEFIGWLDEHVQPHMQHVFNCTLEGEINDINKITIGKSNYLCHRTGIIIAVSAGMFVMLVLLTGTLAFKIINKRRKRRKNHIEKFLMNFTNGILDGKFLLFLSYSSEDRDVVLEHVYPKLDNILKEMVGQEEENGGDIICFGDRHFAPGASIILEMMRCIKDSLVVVFVVTRTFCSSAWCRLELKEAYEQEKPIILIFKEQIDQDIMPQYLLNIFHRYTRVRLVRQEDGRYDVIPRWTLLCESIIQLASNYKEEEEEEAAEIV